MMKSQSSKRADKTLKPSKRTLKFVLTSLIWLATSLPLVLLAMLQAFSSYQQSIEIQQQQLRLDTEKLSLNISNDMQKTMEAINQLAVKGTTITSSQLGMSTPDIKRDLFMLQELHPSLSAAMIVDPYLFLTEASPERAFQYNLQPFESFFYRMFLASEVFTKTGPRILPIERRLIEGGPKSARADYIAAVTRPILTPLDSLNQPFEVSSLLHLHLSLNDYFYGFFNGSNWLQTGRYAAVYFNEQIIFEFGRQPDSEHRLEVRENLPLGSQVREFTIVVKQPLSLIATLKLLLVGSAGAWVVIVVLIPLFFWMAVLLTRRIVNPINSLQQLTQDIKSADYETFNPNSIPHEDIAFRELSDFRELLVALSQKVVLQVGEISENNKALKLQTQNLNRAVQLSEQQQQVLTELMRYSVDLQQLTSTNEICKRTQALVFRICNVPSATFLKSSQGECLSENVQLDISSIPALAELGALMARNADIEAAFAESDDYALEVIRVEGQIQGVIVFAQSVQGEFKQYALQLLLTSLKARLEQLQLLKRLDKMAHSDALTGVFNRHAFERQYQLMLQKYIGENRGKSSFAVFVIDVNGLKRTNDELGHEAGDALIQAVANLLQASVRRSDIVARVGGDEFCLLLDGANADYCATFAVQLAEQARQAHLMVNKERVAVSFSLGYASLDVDDQARMIEIADERMYADKKKYYLQREN